MKTFFTGKLACEWLTKIKAKPHQAKLFVFDQILPPHPSLFGEPFIHNYYRSEYKIDLSNIYYYNLCRSKNLPMIGFGSGAAFLCAMAGGHVFQYVKHHYRDHTAFTCNGEVITCESSHNYMMNPYNLPVDDYKIIAVSENLISSYEDALETTVELPEDFNEPEIVWFPKINALTLHCRPYFQGKKNTDSQQIIKNIINDFINKKIQEYPEGKNCGIW